MMKKTILLPVILFFLSQGLFAQTSPFPVDPGIRTVIRAMTDSSRNYAANEAFLESGRLQRDSLMSMIYPQINLEIETSAYNNFKTVLPDDIELVNNYTLSATPEITISQLLPSSGTLTGSITNTFSGSGIEESNYLLQPQSDLTLSNEISLSVGLKQPLYSGNAYQASITGINEAWEMTGINYMINRNDLAITAVSDFYELTRSAYQVELIKSRLKTNTEQFRKKEKELQLGAATRSQLNSSRAAMLQSEADLLEAEQEFRTLKALFKAIYGLDFDGLNNGTGGMPSVNRFPMPETGKEELSGTLINNNPDLQISRKKILTAESEIVIEEKNAAMNFIAGGNFSYKKGITETEALSDGLSLSIGLSAPLSDGGASAATIARKKNEAFRLREEYNDSLERTISNLSLALDTIAVYEKLAEIYGLQEETGITELETGLKEFELGTITQTDLIDLQISLENIRLSVLTNRINSNLAILSLYKMLGYDLIGLIGDVNGIDK